MNDIGMFLLCLLCGIIMSAVTAIISIIKTQDKMTDEYHDKLNQNIPYGSVQKDDMDFPGLIACPNCKNTQITIRRNMNIPNIYISCGRVEFNKNDIYVTYKVICPKCGLQTMDFEYASKAIMNWNGRSESTEIIKKEN